MNRYPAFRFFALSKENENHPLWFKAGKHNA